ncbi:MAG: glycosyltransferase [Euryarchaeota archaeon]|nr:glycosyltransferase [Euryarchaeota archaeon]
MVGLEEYRAIVGDEVIEELRLLSEKLSGTVVQNINSTAVGGGVAEILHRMVPLLKELGIDARWNVMKGGERFFEVTKKFHNALHGAAVDLSEKDFSTFLETTQQNLQEISLSDDIIFVHDPQPVAMIKGRKRSKARWIWRCHIDLSAPDGRVWSFIRSFVAQYDASVFTAPSFARVLPIRRYLIAPSIDPLSEKNKELSESAIELVLRKYDINQEKPIVAQISRFDRLKDPLGVIEAYRLVKRRIDCQLVLAGGGAADDPEGEKVLREVEGEAESDRDIHVLPLPSGSDLEINALQRAAAVVVQKSIKEGFGLTVSEALWKGKPVVASAVGGMPLQINHGNTGLLSHSVEGAAYHIRKLLRDKEFAERLGRNGREHVRQNFLLTRHLKDYLLLFLLAGHHQENLYL